VPGGTWYSVYPDYVLGQLAWAAALWMLFVLYRIFSNGELFISGIIGFGLMLLVAYTAARIAMQNTWSELVFSGNSFALRSVSDALQQTPPAWFPIAYAVAQLGSGRLQIHYHDRVVTLTAADWPGFEAITNHFSNPEPVSSPAT